VSDGPQLPGRLSHAAGKVSLRTLWNVVTLGTAAFLVLVFTGCSKSKPAATQVDDKVSGKAKSPAAWFEEVASSANLTFKHSSGHGFRFYIP